ncbi:DUF721 domain-containing protein [Leifsonia virtsii]|uniref:DciA family protein n=1 Tax=Leifsonia virtsii TaxID=3035915 RepID=A0ABT8IYV7_9MICO|nr:DciA family protein [Leifsonia virtsii]MDN4598002.1 DciA family protein [Leifsonia virtsii]
MPERTAASTESSAVYLRLKALFAGTSSRSRRLSPRSAEDGSSRPFGVGRDPKGVGDVLDSLTAQLGWTGNLAKSDLMSGWVELAGEETAKHSYPESVADGVLNIRCDSTAWARQLTSMRSLLLKKMAEVFPDAEIESIVVRGPNVRSWNHGPRSIPGRGPRDTYG